MRYFALLFACLTCLLAGPAFAASMSAAPAGYDSRAAVTPHAGIILVADSASHATAPAAAPGGSPPDAAVGLALARTSPSRPGAILASGALIAYAHPNNDGKGHRQDKCLRL